jgi:hypothetical protein
LSLAVIFLQLAEPQWKLSHEYMYRIEMLIFFKFFKSVPLRWFFKIQSIDRYPKLIVGNVVTVKVSFILIMLTFEAPFGLQLMKNILDKEFRT